MIARAASGAADGIALAAAPTFAAMALASAIGTGPSDPYCGSTPGFPLGGMTAMYLLMAGFHFVPWLKRAARFRGSIGD